MTRRLIHRLPAYWLARGAIRYLRANGAVALLREAGTRLAWRVRAGTPLSSPSYLGLIIRQYEQWSRDNSPNEQDLSELRRAASRFAYKPLISVLMPVYDVDAQLLNKAIESVLQQAYPNWELCIVDDASSRGHLREVLSSWKATEPRVQIAFLDENSGISNATNRALSLALGEFVALLDHDDELTPDALFEVGLLLNNDPSLDLIYSDEDKLDGMKPSPIDPFFKPNWSPDLLRSMNYITHLTVIRRTLLEDIGGFRQGFEGSQDYDVLLRIAARTNRIAHIPRPLYHWRKISGSAAARVDAKPYAYEAGRRALEEDLHSRDYSGRVEVLAPGRYRVRYTHVTSQPVSAVIIDPPDLLEVSEVLQPLIQGRALQEVILVISPRREAEVEQARFSGASWRILTMGDASWASGANAACRLAEAPQVLFLDSRVAGLTRDAVESLLEHSQRSEIGVVGGTVVDPAGRIAEAGLIVSRDETAVLVTPTFVGWRSASPGYFGLAESVRNTSAVSRACMMVSRRVLEREGEFDESLSSTLCEVDFCFRAREDGLFVLVTPFARVLTGEISAPGSLSLPHSDQQQFLRRWGPKLFPWDPYWSPNLIMEWGKVRLRVDPGAKARVGRS